MQTDGRTKERKERHEEEKKKREMMGMARLVGGLRMLRMEKDLALTLGSDDGISESTLGYFNGIDTKSGLEANQ